MPRSPLSARTISPSPSAADEADEPVLVRRAQDGDVAAFEALYRRAGGVVFALCLRMAGDRAVAEELAHDAFVRAWEKLSTFRGDAAFGTWMYRLTANVVLERQRSERRRAAHEVTAGGDDEERDGRMGEARTERPGVARAWPDEAGRIDLEAGIRTLPPNARMVFVMHEVHGYQHEEIAATMGIAPGTVRAHLHRARRLLRDYLSP